MTQNSFYGFTLWAVPRFHRVTAAEPATGAKRAAGHETGPANILPFPAVASHPAPAAPSLLPAAEATA